MKNLNTRPLAAILSPALKAAVLLSCVAVLILPSPALAGKGNQRNPESHQAPQPLTPSLLMNRVAADVSRRTIPAQEVSTDWRGRQLAGAVPLLDQNLLRPVTPCERTQAASPTVRIDIEKLNNSFVIISWSPTQAILQCLWPVPGNFTNVFSFVLSQADPSLNTLLPLPPEAYGTTLFFYDPETQTYDLANTFYGVGIGWLDEFGEPAVKTPGQTAGVILPSNSVPGATNLAVTTVGEVAQGSLRGP